MSKKSTLFTEYNEVVSTMLWRYSDKDNAKPLSDDSKWSDIISDGGLDPRGKYEADRRPKLLSEHEIYEVMGKCDWPSMLAFARGIEAKIKGINLVSDELSNMMQCAYNDSLKYDKGEFDIEFARAIEAKVRGEK